MNADLDKLHPYPFEKLNQLKAQVTAPADREHIALSIGEPKHAAPDFIAASVTQNLDGLSRYPLTKGTAGLREAIAGWLNRRFKLQQCVVDAEHHVLPVNGTREALFAFAQAMVNRADRPLVMMPNPFYQIYEGAAILAGAEPVYVNTTAEHDYLPDFRQFSDEQWQRCQLVYLCSPGNPTGKVLPRETYEYLLEKSDQYNFVIASDECYSEIYFDEQQPPLGLLEVCEQLGRQDFKNCVVFHSLSKRSNLPGLRSGFVAGDAGVMKKFLLYRTYHGCAMSPMVQMASIDAWNDEAHVRQNRQLYREKFQQVLELLSPLAQVEEPDAGFYLWFKTPIDDRDFAQQLFAQENITVLPGQFLSRDTSQGNPGQNRVRMALVATVEECTEAAERIGRFLKSL
jgi:N-succinyldiaminopimelate aminotransferase